MFPALESPKQKLFPQVAALVDQLPPLTAARSYPVANRHYYGQDFRLAQLSWPGPAVLNSSLGSARETQDDRDGGPKARMLHREEIGVIWRTTVYWSFKMKVKWWIIDWFAVVSSVGQVFDTAYYQVCLIKPKGLHGNSWWMLCCSAILLEPTISQCSVAAVEFEVRGTPLTLMYFASNWTL